jgi:hypothetical protein
MRSYTCEIHNDAHVTFRQYDPDTNPQGPEGDWVLIDDARELEEDNARLTERLAVLTTAMDATLDLRMKIKRMDEVVSAARACTVWEDRETFEAMRKAVGEYDAAEESLAVHRPGEGKP